MNWMFDLIGRSGDLSFKCLLLSRITSQRSYYISSGITLIKALWYWTAATSPSSTGPQWSHAGLKPFIFIILMDSSIAIVIQVKMAVRKWNSRRRSPESISRKRVVNADSGQEVYAVSAILSVYYRPHKKRQLIDKASSMKMGVNS